MVNAAAAAARFHAALPEWQMPEHTGDRDGFFHLTRIVGTESDAEIRLIVRDFAAGANDRRIGLLQAQRAWFMALHPGLGIDLEVTEQYRNMKEVLDRHPATVEVARKAMDAAGVAVIERAIRGGTDGARLCFMGIPTPNLFAGGLLPHSRKEWIPVSALQKATEVIIALACLWHDRP
jgi:tripeptide aminopeptidase